MRGLRALLLWRGRLTRLLRIGGRLGARVVFEILRRRVARAFEAAQPLTIDGRRSRSLRSRVLGRLALLRIVVGLLRGIVGRSLRLRLTVALLRITRVLLCGWRVLRSLLGRLRALRGAAAGMGILLARCRALTTRPSAVRGTLGARHLENPSKR